MDEERSERREEDGQGERLCDKRCIQVDVPWLSHKNRRTGFALHRTPLMLYSTSRDMTSMSNACKADTLCSLIDMYEQMRIKLYVRMYGPLFHSPRGHCLLYCQ